MVSCPLIKGGHLLKNDPFSEEYYSQWGLVWNLEENATQFLEAFSTNFFGAENNSLAIDVRIHVGMWPHRSTVSL